MRRESPAARSCRAPDEGSGVSLVAVALLDCWKAGSLTGGGDPAVHGPSRGTARVVEAGPGPGRTPAESVQTWPCGASERPTSVRASARSGVERYMIRTRQPVGPRRLYNTCPLA